MYRKMWLICRNIPLIPIVQSKYVHIWPIFVGWWPYSSIWLNPPQGPGPFAKLIDPMGPFRPTYLHISARSEEADIFRTLI